MLSKYVVILVCLNRVHLTFDQIYFPALLNIFLIFKALNPCSGAFIRGCHRGALLRVWTMVQNRIGFSAKSCNVNIDYSSNTHLGIICLSLLYIAPQQSPLQTICHIASISHRGSLSYSCEFETLKFMWLWTALTLFLGVQLLTLSSPRERSSCCLIEARFIILIYTSFLLLGFTFYSCA